MKKYFLFFIFLQGACYPLFSQDSIAISLSKLINPDNLKTHVYILASDSLEGRETGEAGQKKAAAYISGIYEHLGLNLPVKDEKPSYFQSFIIEKKTSMNGELTARGKKYRFPDEFVYLNSGEVNGEKKELEVVFAGKGDSADYRDLDVRNKAVMIFYSGDRRGRQNRIKIGLSHGSRDFFILYLKDKESFANWVSGNRSYLTGSTMDLPDEEETNQGSNIFYLPPETGAEIMGIKISRLEKWMEKNKTSSNNIYRKIKPVAISYQLKISVENISTENVAGLIRGTEYPGQVVVVSAHYDHLGKEDSIIYHGADDDASGTAAVMELARIFSKAHELGLGPKRSILFLAFTGEEKGLMGSEYYTQNPLYSLDSTVADFNIDMVGRVDQKHFKNPAYIYLIGSDKVSKELHEISERCNAIYSNLELDYSYNSENDPYRYYYRSDHYNFAKHQIPVIFYYSGEHADYHQSTDTADKILYEAMADRVKLIFQTVWEVANRDTRLKID